jgi:hypothetical protein
MDGASLSTMLSILCGSWVFAMLFKGPSLISLQKRISPLLRLVQSDRHDGIPISIVAYQNKYAPFFEIVIRYLGGLLSAYALSGKPGLLSRADDLGSKPLPTFNSSSGLPYYAVNTVKFVLQCRSPKLTFTYLTAARLELVGVKACCGPKR